MPEDWREALRKCLRIRIGGTLNQILNPKPMNAEALFCDQSLAVRRGPLLVIAHLLLCIQDLRIQGLGLCEGLRPQGFNQTYHVKLVLILVSCWVGILPKTVNMSGPQQHNGFVMLGLPGFCPCNCAGPRSFVVTLRGQLASSHSSRHATFNFCSQGLHKGE